MTAAVPVVLFVDDEEDVLSGLRTTLRKLRRTHDLRFASGGHEALALIEAEPVDVVITDMRMPQLTGVDVLEVVKRRRPEAIRYVLSGEAEAELVIRSVPVAHRWLAKPCERDTLVSAIEEAVRHGRLVSDPTIRAALAEVDALPSAPALYAELLDELADGDASLDRVAELVSSDPAISAKLLQWANSAFSGGHAVSDVRGAVGRVGLVTVTQLVLSVEVFRAFDATASIPGLAPEVFHDHAKAVAGIAAALAVPDQAIEAGVGGLFSTVGLLVEATHLRDRLAVAYQEAERTGRPLIDVERELYGLAHPEIGGHLLALWGLPSQLVLIAAASHELPDLTPGHAAGTFDAGAAVKTARLLAGRLPAADAIGVPHRRVTAESSNDRGPDDSGTDSNDDGIDSGIDRMTLMHLDRLNAELGDLQELTR